MIAASTATRSLHRVGSPTPTPMKNTILQLLIGLCCIAHIQAQTWVPSPTYGTNGATNTDIGSGFDASYTPKPQQSETYQQLYKHYQSLGKFTEQNA